MRWPAITTVCSSQVKRYDSEDTHAKGEKPLYGLLTIAIVSQLPDPVHRCPVHPHHPQYPPPFIVRQV